jgi:hypothetical protein
MVTSTHANSPNDFEWLFFLAQSAQESRPLSYVGCRTRWRVTTAFGEMRSGHLQMLDAVLEFGQDSGLEFESNP